MSLFARRSIEQCQGEIQSSATFIKNNFDSEMNLNRLQIQINKLVDEKIDDYFHQRFRDWSIGDLILLSKVITQEMDLEAKRLEKKTISVKKK